MNVLLYKARIRWNGMQFGDWIHWKSTAIVRLLSNHFFKMVQNKIAIALVIFTAFCVSLSHEDILTQALESLDGCSKKTGCHMGYCWAYCGLSLSSGDWCYTTMTHTQSFDYVPCTHDSECCGCWKCAGCVCMSLSNKIMFE